MGSVYHVTHVQGNEVRNVEQVRDYMLNAGRKNVSFAFLSGEDGERELSLKIAGT